MKEQNNIEQEAPLLFSLDKKQKLKVPENYFAQLPSELKKLAKEDKREKVVLFNKVWTYAIAFAAAILIGVFIINPSEETMTQEVIAYNNDFNNLTAEDFELLLLTEENDYLSANIEYDNIGYSLYEESPSLTIEPFEITAQDFETYFESEIEDY